MHFRYNLTLLCTLRHSSLPVSFAFVSGNGIPLRNCSLSFESLFFSCLLIFFTVFFNCLFNCLFLALCLLLVIVTLDMCLFYYCSFCFQFFLGSNHTSSITIQITQLYVFFFILHCSTFLLVRSPCRTRHNGRSCSGGKQISHFSWFLNLNNFDNHQLCISRRRIHLNIIY